MRTSMLFLLLISFSFSFAQGFIFKNGTEGYAVYRIPAIVKTNSGKLLAFCEGRKYGSADSGDIDLVMKTSIDKGVTWSALKVVWDNGSNSCGNPSPVIDFSSGAVVVVATLNNKSCFVLRSTNEGENWATPKNITDSVKPANWRWYASGPGHALQYRMSNGKRRIIVPCNHTVSINPNHFAHVIYSDNGGITWRLGGTVPTDKTDECTVVKLSNGTLMLNMRTNDRTLPNRKKSFSSNDGLTWSAAVYDSLIDPICQGSLLRHSASSTMLLFTNCKHKLYRQNLTMSISYDNGKTWPGQIPIVLNASAYSDMVELPDQNILCIYEAGSTMPNIGIAVKTIAKSTFVIN